MRKPTQATFPHRRRGLFVILLGTMLLAGPAKASPAAPAVETMAEVITEAARALEAGDLVAAEASFRRAAEITPEDPIPWLGLAEVHERNGELIRALQAAREAVARAPENTVAVRTTGRLLARVGASAEALEMLTKARELAPEDPLSYLLEGLLLRDLGRTEQARDLLAGARDRGLVTSDLLEELGLLHLALGEANEALEVATAGIAREPDHPGLQAALGLALAAIPERRGEATPRLRQALEGTAEGSIKGATLRLELGTLLVESGGENEAALELLRSAQRSLPEDPETWYRLATALRAAGDDDAARQALERFQALSHRQDEAERLGKELGIELNTVQDLASANQLSEAREKVSGLIERFPTAAAGWLLRAKILISLGQAEEALPDLAEAGELEPQDPEIPFLEGVLLYQLGHGGKAGPALDRAVALAPGLGQAWALLGILALQDEDAAAAAEAFQHALDAGTDTADVRLAYAEALEHLGRGAERAEQLEAYRRLRETP